MKTADTLREVLDTLQARIDGPNETQTSDLKECWNKISGAVNEIESARNEPLDHLRQQLEARVKDSKLITETPYYAGVKNGIRIGFEEAISLIDQLKAETKNT